MKVDDGDCKEETGVKMDDEDEDDDNGGCTRRVGDSEEIQVRDIRYQLESLGTRSFPYLFSPEIISMFHVVLF